MTDAKFFVFLILTGRNEPRKIYYSTLMKLYKQLYIKRIMGNWQLKKVVIERRRLSVAFAINFSRLF